MELREHKSSFLSTIRKLRYWLTHHHYKIVTFGPSGTGKTTLGHLLAGDFTPGYGEAGYEMSIDVEKFSLPGHIVASVLVAPGQERRAFTWQELHRELTRGTIRGVINVVSWGYRHFRQLHYTDLPYYQAGMTKEKFLARHLAEGRAAELRVIDELVPRLIDAGRDLWMITLVTHQDLWWKDRRKVETYYKQGEYNDRITHIIAARGAQHFEHQYLAASLVMDNLSDDRGEILAPTTAGYDQKLQYANLNELFKAVDHYVDI